MEKKEKCLIIGMVALLVLFLSGCSTTLASAPFFYSNNTNYEFIILGEVTYASTTKYGFQELLKAARSKYPNCDYVIDVMVDSTIETTSYLLSFLFKTKAVVTYSMRGTAIQYIQNISGKQAISANDQNTTASAKTIVSTESTVPTHANVDVKSTSVTVIAGSYTVKSVNGNIQKYMKNTWTDLKVGDILTKETFIDIVSNSSLVLVDGNVTITCNIPAGNRQTVESFIKNFGNK